MEITKDDLRRYREIKIEIDAIENQIRAIYEGTSAKSDVLGGKSSVHQPGDPTARKAMRAIEKKEQLEKRRNELERIAEAVEEYANNLKDYTVASIIRWHYIQGLSWQQTCVKIYGYPDPDVCRKVIWRHFRNK